MYGQRYLVTGLLSSHHQLNVRINLRRMDVAMKRSNGLNIQNV